jgi:AcrR family transcriptional regulator
LQIHVNDVNMDPMKKARTPRRDSYHHGDLRNALLETALALVAERGPEAFSLREAARAVGVSPAAAYRHFSDKTALLIAIASDGDRRLAAAMERAIARLPPASSPAAHALAVLSATGEAYVEFAVRHPSHFRVMFGPAARSESFEPCCAPSGRGPYDILVDALDQLVASGAIPPERRPGGEIAAWAAVHGLAALFVEGTLPIAPRARGDAFRVVARTLALGLGCDPALVPEPGQVPDPDPRRAKPPPRPPTGGVR